MTFANRFLLAGITLSLYYVACVLCVVSPGVVSGEPVPSPSPSPSRSPSPNTRPVIGILTLPYSGPYNGTSYFPASYVKWVESGGARVVPIHYDASPVDILNTLRSINGALFTGGGASLAPDSTYFKAVSLIYNFVVETNSDGEYFPLWGTCLGFESLIRAQSQDANILDHFLAENITLALEFMPAAQTARVFSSSVPGAEDAYEFLSNYNITMNNHQSGITPQHFIDTPRLSGFFDMLATDPDRQGKQFVAMIQGKNVPIYGTQFHPEKSVYEWDSNEVMKHTRQAVFAAQYLADFFVDESRRSFNTFPTWQALKTALIYNTNAVFTDTDFDQCYFWNYN
jgi:gamma-glutamyl hydrolase